MPLKKFFQEHIDSEKWLQANDSQEKFASLVAQTAIKLAKQLNTPKKISTDKFLRTMFSVILGHTISKELFESTVYVNFIDHLDILEKQDLRITLMHYLKDYQGQDESFVESLFSKGITNNRHLLVHQKKLDEVSAEKAHNLIWAIKDPKKMISKKSLLMELDSCKKKVKKLENML